MNELETKVRSWDSENRSGNQTAESEYQTILAQLQYHAVNEWSEFLPAENPVFNSNYMVRLAKWIGNAATEEDQKLLLKYALHINFFSHADFVSLYRTAFNREVFPWVTSQIGINLGVGCSPFQDKLDFEVRQCTWFCPITDSMKINEFYKVNHITGFSDHPEFVGLQKMAKTNASITQSTIDIMNHQSPELKRLVLLEDIVGSATQCIGAIRWALLHLKCPVLFIPLILCPNGVDKLMREEQSWGGQLTVKPVIKLTRDDLLGPERGHAHGWDISDSMEDLTKRCSTQASPSMDCFGYKSTGCSIAMHTNTPDNTLPLVHNQTSNWEPIFPRIPRGD